MSQHDNRMRLRHMLDYGQEALGLTKGKQRADLESDRILALALTRLLEIVGEAANRVSQEMRRSNILRYPGDKSSACAIGWSTAMMRWI